MKDKNKDFHPEWYHNRFIEKAARLFVLVLQILTLPLVSSSWVFALLFFLGGFSAWYAILIAAIVFFFSQMIWKNSFDKLLLPENDKPNLEEE